MSEQVVSQRREAVREFVTMALYVSLSLLAVVIATPEMAATRSGVAATVFLTALGLLIAHVLAYSVSSRLVSEGRIDAESRLILTMQVAAGLTVAVIATIPVLLADAPLGPQITEGLLVGIVAVVGYLAVRQRDGSRGRALVYAGAVIAGVAVVLLMKSLVH